MINPALVIRAAVVGHMWEQASKCLQLHLRHFHLKEEVNVRQLLRHHLRRIRIFQVRPQWAVTSIVLEEVQGRHLVIQIRT